MRRRPRAVERREGAGRHRERRHPACSGCLEEGGAAVRWRPHEDDQAFGHLRKQQRPPHAHLRVTPLLHAVAQRRAGGGGGGGGGSGGGGGLGLRRVEICDEVVEEARPCFSPRSSSRWRRRADGARAADSDPPPSLPPPSCRRRRRRRRAAATGRLEPPHYRVDDDLIRKADERRHALVEPRAQPRRAPPALAARVDWAREAEAAPRGETERFAREVDARRREGRARIARGRRLERLGRQRDRGVVGRVKERLRRRRLVARENLP